MAAFRSNCPGGAEVCHPPLISCHLFTISKRLKTPKLYIKKCKPLAKGMESQNDHSEVRCPLSSLSSWPLPAALFQKALSLWHKPNTHLMYSAFVLLKKWQKTARDTWYSAWAPACRWGASLLFQTTGGKIRLKQTRKTTPFLHPFVLRNIQHVQALLHGHSGAFYLPIYQLSCKWK